MRHIDLIGSQLFPAKGCGTRRAEVKCIPFWTMPLKAIIRNCGQGWDASFAASRLPQPSCRQANCTTLWAALRWHWEAVSCPSVFCSSCYLTSACVPPDIGDVLRQGDVFERIAAAERILSDDSHAVGKGQLFHGENVRSRSEKGIGREHKSARFRSKEGPMYMAACGFALLRHFIWLPSKFAA